MQREEIGLSDALTHLLEESRMVLPGIQALFGFQMIAVFNETFSKKLSLGQQKAHVVAIVLVVVSIALVMTPAVVHRLVEPRLATERFIMVASRLLLAAMVPLALAICIDVSIVTVLVWNEHRVTAFVSIAIGLIFLLSWVLYPRIYRAQTLKGPSQ